MSYFDDASLVLIPSGIKNQKIYSVKPLDGSGDLTFSRASSATRFASNGLIEKVRTNLLLQSNTFNTTWTASNASVTSGQTGYDGTNNAWLLSKSAANGYILQSPASSGLETFSVYAKAGTDNWLHFLIRDSASVFFGGYFDLQNGVVGSAIGSTTLSIQSVGNGWYRCSASFTKSTSNYYRIYPAEGNNDTSGTSGNILIQNAQLEVGDIATQYIATTTAAVSVGPVSGLPRLDYLNSSCPRLLLEPQRSNLAQYSEQMDNAAWSKNGVTVTANAAVSPDGSTNADKIVETATTGPHGLAPTYSIANSTTYTFSVFAKKAENDYVIMNIYTGVASTFTSFNVANGTIGTTGVGATAKIENYGSGWYRCMLTVTTAATGSPNIFMWTARANDAIEYTGNGVNGTFMYGCVLEAGAYATSYIPTLGTSVTRVADAASKTGISSLIGQTEGTLFYDGFYGNEINELYLFLQKESSSGVDDSIYIQQSSNAIALNVYSGATQQTFIIGGSPTLGQRIKIAAAYKANDFVLYVNGVQIGTDNSGAVPTCGALQLGSYRATPTASNFIAAKGINQTLLFKTRLTNAQLAELTTL